MHVAPLNHHYERVRQATGLKAEDKVAALLGLR